MLFFVTQLHWGSLALIAGGMTLAIMIVLPLIMRRKGSADGRAGYLPRRLVQPGVGRLRAVLHCAAERDARHPVRHHLAIGRIVSETAALIFTAGTMAQIPGLFQSGRTLAIHMYAVRRGPALNKQYATAVVLLVVVLLMNALSAFVAKKLTKK